MSAATAPPPEPSPALRLGGHGHSIEARGLELYLRIRTKAKGRKARTAEYRLGLLPPPEGDHPGVVCSWRFDKLLPETDRYTVTVYEGDRLACDCPHATYHEEDGAPLCPHKDAVLALMAAFRPRPLPVPRPRADCPECKGVGYRADSQGFPEYCPCRTQGS